MLIDLNAEIRKSICARCPHPCEDFNKGAIDFEHPAESCRARWVGSWHAIKSVNPPTRIRLGQPRPTRGRAAWNWLRAQAAANALSPAILVAEFEPMIPHGCGCLKGYRGALEAFPLPVDDQFAWHVDIHNFINAELLATGLPEHADKRQWTVAEAWAEFDANREV